MSLLHCLLQLEARWRSGLVITPHKGCLSRSQGFNPTGIHWTSSVLDEVHALDVCTNVQYLVSPDQLDTGHLRRTLQYARIYQKMPNPTDLLGHGHAAIALRQLSSSRTPA